MISEAADFLCKYRVARPDKSRQQRKEVACRIKAHSRAVEANEHNSGHGCDKAYKKADAELFFFYEYTRQDRGEKRRYGNDDAYI